MQDLDWHDLKFVLTVAREKSLAPAAKALRVNETTVARRIARAEAALKSQIFHRTKGALVPTSVGTLVIEHAEKMEAEIQVLGELATGMDSAVVGSVRITSIPLLVNRLLIPAVRALKAEHPMLRVELVAEPRNLSLTRRDADIALRMARPDKEQRVIARKIGNFPYAVYAPAGMAYETLPWIALEDAMAHLPHVAWMTRAMQAERASAPFLVVNDSELAFQSIRAGLGKSLLPCAVGDHDPDLVRISGDAPVLSRELWLLVHPELRSLARIKVAIAWLEQVVARNTPNDA